MLGIGTYGDSLTLTSSGKILSPNYGLYSDLGGGTVLNYGTIAGQSMAVKLVGVDLINSGLIYEGQLALQL